MRGAALKESSGLPVRAFLMPASTSCFEACQNGLLPGMTTQAAPKGLPGNSSQRSVNETTSRQVTSEEVWKWKEEKESCQGQ